MTQVKLLYKEIDGATLDGVPITDGLVAVWPVRQRNTVGGLLTTKARTYAIGSTISLAPDSYYFQLIDVDDGRGGELTGADAVTCRVVPPAGGPYEIDDLAIGNPGPVADLPPDWQLWVADYVTTHAPTGGSGFPTPAQIQGSTTVGQALIVAADQAAGRAAIGAGTSNLAIGTTGSTAKAGNYVPTWSEITSKPATFAPTAHTHPVGEIATTGGVASTSTFLRGDGTWATPATGGGTTIGGITDVPGLVAALDAITARLVALESGQDNHESRIDQIEAIGANAVVIKGATAARVNQFTGNPLPAGAVALFDAEGTPPVNALVDDLTYNRNPT